MQGKDQNEPDGIRIPWPGPRPYDEHEWRDFFGRGQEIQDIVKRVRVEKLTVLLGGSGSGKTSLIRAGVVAVLRNYRYLRNDKSSWPVLLLRRWGARGDSNLESNLLDQLESAIDTIGKWSSNRGQALARMDADFLRSIVRRNSRGARKSLVQIVETLAREQAQRQDENVTEEEASLGSGLIIVFDQFEELLRSSKRARTEILRMIGDLVESKAPTRILLSMRQEYRYALRDLEVLLGGLGNRSLYLEQLDEPSVIQVIEKVSGSGQLGVDRDVARVIVEWLGIDHRKLLSERESLEEGQGADEPAEGEAVARPDLLRLQAVLVDLCQFALEAGAKRVTEEVLQQFVSVRGKEGRKGWASGETLGRVQELESEEGALLAEGRIGDARVQEVLDGALERWIESAIASGASDETSPDAHASKLESEDLGLLVRRIAVRLAPLLSSADYKVAQEENVLLRQALGEDIGKLFPKDPRLVSKLTIIEADNKQEPHLDWQAIGGIEELPKESRQFVLSGRSHIDGWTLEQTGDRLLCCFRETLSRLKNANILQRTTLGDQEGKIYWELVHDQFGPHFTKWAEEQKGTWDDCRSSLVVSRGIQPIAIQDDLICPIVGKEFYDLESISWQGCGVAHASSRRVKLRNVRFQDCFLLGTIFEKIDFIGCEFNNCELKGALFRECNFWFDQQKRPTIFRECHSNIAIIRGTIEGLEFRNCQLNQPAIKEATLEGDLIYREGSTVIQGLFEKITVGRGKTAKIVVKSDSTAAYCFASIGEGLAPLEVEREHPTLSNSPLPDEFLTRR